MKNEEKDMAILGKAYFILRGTERLVAAIVDGDDPKLDAYWALDEIATKLRELTIAFQKKQGE